MPITANSRPHFSAWLKAEADISGIPHEKYLWDGMAIIAKTYHFQPSEIDELDLLDFFEWLKRC